MAPDPSEVLDAYAGLYVDQEVRAEHFTRNIGSFNRFLEALSFSNGSQINISARARECGVERKAIAGCVSILEDLLLAYSVPRPSRAARPAFPGVDGESELQVFEVKNARRGDPHDLRLLRAFRGDYPMAEMVILYRGQDRLRIDGIWFFRFRTFFVISYRIRV